MAKKDDSIFLEELLLHNRKTAALHTNAYKKWCEKTVCGEFLTRIGLSFNENEIELVEQSKEPPDIIFRKANFEIMYITGDRKPHDEAKDRFKQANA